MTAVNTVISSMAAVMRDDLGERAVRIATAQIAAARCDEMRALWTSIRDILTDDERIDGSAPP